MNFGKMYDIITLCCGGEKFPGHKNFLKEM